MVKILIDRGANINSKDNKERTPLHKAAFKSNLKIFCVDRNKQKIHIFRSLGNGSTINRQGCRSKSQNFRRKNRNTAC